MLTIVAARAATISGKVGPIGQLSAPLAGVTLCVSDSSVTCSVPDSAGNYTCNVNQLGWSGSIHPRVSGQWVAAATFSNVTQNVVRNFDAHDGSCVLDVDRNGLIDPSTDGLSILRRMAGFSQIGLGNLSGVCAQSNTDAAVFTNANPALFNVNGGGVSATSDALMLVRAMRSLRDSNVTSRANDTASVTIPAWFAAQCGGTLSIVSTDTVAPSVSLAASATTVTAAGTLTLTATAADNVGVTRVEFYEGTTLIAVDSSSPYSTSLALTAAENGTRGYSARAYDAANQQAASTPVNVVVNIANGTTPALSAVVASATRVNLSWNAVSGATKYELERATQSGRYVRHASIAAGVTSYVDQAQNTTSGTAPNLVIASNIVTPGTRYRYRLRAQTATGATAWSATDVTTTGSTFSGIGQEPIEFRYVKPRADASYAFAPMNPVYALVYLPPGYFDVVNANKKYPVVVFRHGLGQFAGSVNRDQLSLLYAPAAAGTPPHKVTNDSSFRPDAIVVSPQLPWNFDETSDEEVRLMGGLRDYLELHYRVDPLAVHITGLSAGTGAVLIHAARGERPLASWSVISNQGWGNAIPDAAAYARIAQIPSWHAANLGTGGDSATQSTLTNLLITNGGGYASNGGHINSFYFCNSPSLVATNTPVACSSGGGHDAWTKAYSFTNAYQAVNYWQWIATQRVAAPRVLSAGTYHSLGVTGATASAWGSTRAGQLGIVAPSLVNYPAPAAISLTDDIVAMSAGGYHSLAINRAGEIWSFGFNEAGQRGNGTVVADSNGVVQPLKLANGGENFVAVASGGLHNLALSASGSVYGWGSNVNGQVGVGVTTPSTTHCGGSAGNTPANARITVPTLIDIPVPVKRISAGYCNSFALDVNGDVWSWGHGGYQLANLGRGSSTLEADVTPRRLPSLSNIVEITSGDTCNYALKQDGTVFAWGTNSTGCIGNNNKGTGVPTPVSVMTDARAIAGRADGVYVIKKDGSLWSWGESKWGSVGNGTINALASVPYDAANTRPVLQPVRISNWSDVVSVHSGGASNHVFAVRSNGSVWAWGRNKNGALGNGRVGDSDFTNATPDDENVATPQLVNF